MLNSTLDSTAKAICPALCTANLTEVVLCDRSFLFYCLRYIYPKGFRRLPVTMDSRCAKSSSNGLPDRTAHNLVSSNQKAPRRDVIMAGQKPPVLTYYGTCPFNFTISHNSVNTNSITSVPGLNDGKICPLYINTSALFLRQGLTKSHFIPHPNLGCASATALNLALLY